jgi:hypothetical protein
MLRQSWNAVADAIRVAAVPLPVSGSAAVAKRASPPHVDAY